MLAIQATTGALCWVMNSKKNKAVTLLMPISKRSSEGRFDWMKNRIQTIISTSAKCRLGINQKNMMKYWVLNTA